MKKVYRLKLLLFNTFVAVLLLINKALIRVMPFKKLIEFYANSTNSATYSGIEFRKVRLVHNALNHFEKILFWKPMCFEQALTAMMLARLFHLPGTIYFGIAKNIHGEIIAHAWSQIGTYETTGYMNKDEFTVVYQMYYAPPEQEG